MFLRTTLALLLAVALIVRACEPENVNEGCEIVNGTCTCGFGCRANFKFRNRKSCISALRGRGNNACTLQPCLRGICIQTAQSPGFTCKCEGTGFYGQRCEKACPIASIHAAVFPHECIVI